MEGGFKLRKQRVEIVVNKRHSLFFNLCKYFLILCLGIMAIAIAWWVLIIVGIGYVIVKYIVPKIQEYINNRNN